MRSSPVAGHNPLNDPAPARPNAHLPCGRVRRYPSDTGDTEWEILAPWVPASGPVPGRGGRPVVYSRRDIVDAIRYVAHNGGVWRALPADFPPWEVVYHYHHTWTADTTLTRMHAALGDQVRLAEGRDAQPSAAIIDSQSVRAAETVAKSSRSYDKGKNVNGRKRHIATDTTGLLLVILVTAAGVQDRDAGRALLRALRACFPRVAEVWADGGYAGRLVEWATTALKLTVQARAHFEGVGHPVIRSAMPGEDWWFCFPTS